MQIARQSTGVVAMGTFALGCGIFPIFRGDLEPWSAIAVLYGLAMISGLYCVPFTAYALRRRPDLLLGSQHVAADADGVRFSNAFASSTIGWPAFRRVREAADTFLLDYGTGAMIFLPKVALGEAGTARFSDLATAAGKLDRSPAWKRTARGIVVGIVVVAIFLSVIVNASQRGG